VGEIEERILLNQANHRRGRDAARDGIVNLADASNYHFMCGYYEALGDIRRTAYAILDAYGIANEYVVGEHVEWTKDGF
jgi:hypothetical protein